MTAPHTPDTLADNIPLTLYIHLPWCVRKCPYCDFNSHAMEPESIPRNDYVTALMADLDAERLWAGDRLVSAIFIGGGTPSLFAPEDLKRLLQYCGDTLNLQPDLEVTMEANPGVLDMRRIAGFRSAGITRLSLGVQSFDDDALKRIGRIHGVQEVEQAIAGVAAAGFKSWNLDLMYGLPQQSEQQLLGDLDRALAVQPPHLSWYQLTLEPNTAFYKQPPPLPAQDELAIMERAGIERILAAGYDRYEVSAWSRAGEHCLHNINYWQYGDYLGIGAGAHAKITRDGQVWRTNKLRQPMSYIKAVDKNAQRTLVSQDELALEFMMNALRLVEGVPRDYFTARTGLAYEAVENALFHADDLGLLSNHPERLQPSELGLRYLNNLLQVFM